RPFGTNVSGSAWRTVRLAAALPTTRSLSTVLTLLSLLSQPPPITAFPYTTLFRSTLDRPGRTVEKNRVIGQVIRRIAPCAEPIRPFLPPPTRQARGAFGTRCPLRTLRTNGAD